jgi:uncharacterized heparinase superfamily protein
MDMAEEVDWVSGNMPKLWRYNLHYFDYVLDPGHSMEEISTIISDWIAKNPPGTADAWEPYTVSLRMVNWVKLFLNIGFPDDSGQAWLDSLYIHALWLERNIEHHILANHYLKNGVALFFAGTFFEGDDAQRWFEKGLRIIREQATEQILPDGGHFERSPMYHCIVVEDYLDILNVAIQNPDLIEWKVVDELVGHARRAVNFLLQIVLPDGQIPLFNDSAVGIASSPRDLVKYANRIIGYEQPADNSGLVLWRSEASGYYVIRRQDDMMVIDCGDVGPGYQPGHAHSDTLSFELALDGRRVIVDSGVYDYEGGELRQHLRGTRAHNTVMVDRENQSEVWAVFRVARRAKPIHAELEGLPSGGARFCGAHDGYRRLRGRVVHERAVEYHPEGRWIITDRVGGRRAHTVESLLHVHPDYRIALADRVASILSSENVLVATITLASPGDAKVEKGWYCPEFGKKFRNDVLVFERTAELPIEIMYVIERN